MRRPFLTHLRGTDGRSLGRALACLVFINAVFAGFLGGQASAAAPGTICSFALAGVDRTPDANTPVAGHAFDCCPGMCSTAGAALLPAGPALFPRVAKLVGADLIPAIAAATPADRANFARGPPILA